MIVFWAEENKIGYLHQFGKSTIIIFLVFIIALIPNDIYITIKKI